jgi:NADH-quinone oxidoreductase subunit N
MYFDEPEGEPIQVRPGRPLQVVFSINAISLLVLGFAWSPLMAWCQRAFGI